MSEAMLGLGRPVSRARARGLFYSLCHTSLKDRMPLIELRAADPEFNRYLDRAVLEKPCDPVNHLDMR
ncbi:MAG: hypothetical protein ABI777_04635 [Betaproteobacteria bacterium]